MARISFPKELYVGVQGRAKFDTTVFPLGFATPYGIDSAGRKRRETVDNWVGGRTEYPVDPNTGSYQQDANGNRVIIDHGDYNGTVIGNDAMNGFQFEKSVSRWSTSNKWFTINDPRGFSLQISAENLGEILLGSAIDRGNIMGEFVWGRVGSINWLTSSKNEEYIGSLKPKGKIVPEIGDILNLGYSEDVQYLGKYFVAEQYEVTEYKDHQTGVWSQDYSYHWGRSLDKRQTTIQSRDPKPWLLFANKDYSGLGSHGYHYQRTLGKTEMVSKKQPLRAVVEDGQPTIHGMGYKTNVVTILFEKKEDVLNCDFTKVHYEDCVVCNGTGKVTFPPTQYHGHSFIGSCPHCKNGKKPVI